MLMEAPSPTLGSLCYVVPPLVLLQPPYCFLYFYLVRILFLRSVSAEVSAEVSAGVSAGVSAEVSVPVMLCLNMTCYVKLCHAMLAIL